MRPTWGFGVPCLWFHPLYAHPPQRQMWPVVCLFSHAVSYRDGEVTTPFGAKTASTRVCAELSTGC